MTASSFLLPTIFCLALLTCTTHGIYQKISLTQANGASCLDGTPPIIYVDQGQGANADKFLLFIDGGGSCIANSVAASLQSCYLRSSTRDGSSAGYWETTELDQNGYLSSLVSVDPVFNGWTKVLIQYCDGFFSISQKAAPFTVNGKNLYFRGVNNMVETFKYLEDNYDFYNKDTIVLSGASAGAMTATYWVEYLADKAVTSKVLALPDSGMYPFDYLVPTLGGINAVELATNLFASQVINPAAVPTPIVQCMIATGKTFAACLDISNLVEFLTVPSFFIQSPYDPTLALYIFQGAITCSVEYLFESLDDCTEVQRQYLEDLRIRVLNDIVKTAGTREDVGVWSPACATHVYLPYQFFNQEIARIRNARTLAQVVAEFLADPLHAKAYIQYDPWLANPECSGLDLEALDKQTKKGLFEEFRRWRQYAKDKITRLEDDDEEEEQPDIQN